MPKSSGNRRSNSKNSADWQQYEFVALPLTEDEKKAFKHQYEQTPNLRLDKLDELLKNGYKVSLNYDTSNNCIQVALTCKEPNSPNFNYVMSSRSPDVWQAISLALYKHYDLCDDEDWGAETREDGRSFG